MPCPECKPSSKPGAIGIRWIADDLIYVGPVTKFMLVWAFSSGYGVSKCTSRASAKRAVTRWQRKLGIDRVVGGDLLETPKRTGK